MATVTLTFNTSQAEADKIQAALKTISASVDSLEQLELLAAILADPKKKQKAVGALKWL